MKPIRLILVDAHGIVRTGLRKLLEVEPDVCVVVENEVCF
jgi:DNA-binding NarL/FixJ family response regulator